MVYRAHVLISGSPQCIAQGAREVEAAIREELAALELTEEVQILQVSTLGHDAQGPEVVIYPEGTQYVKLTPDDARLIVSEHLLKGRPVEKLTYQEPPSEPLPPPTTKEVRVVLDNVGKIDPESIEDYIAMDGYVALGEVLGEMSPEEVIEEMKRSGLRGRGGAGFPTWLKWSFARKASGERKFVVCNADEGDPGAFMNRRVLEGDPHAVLEGMAICGYAIGAQQGYIYVRAEYPLAIHTLRVAITEAREYGLLGEDIFGSGFNFDIEIRMGAGAFVCGEETALMQSIEGDRGMPRTRPPIRPTPASGEIPPTSTTWRRWRMSPRSSIGAATGSRPWARRRAGAQRPSPSPARSSARASLRCRWA